MRRKQLVTVLTSFLIFSAGVLIGGLLVGLFSWAYATVVREETLEPLADLNLPDRPLTGEECDTYINQLGRRYHDQPAACLMIAVVRDDKVRYYPFGKLPNGTPPDKDTIFEIASVGKTLTGLLLADMVERNEVSLTAPIDSLFPPDAGIKDVGGKTITLLDLATQSSGIPTLPSNMPAANPLNPYRDYTVALMYEELGRVKLDFTPGQKYTYSNFGFGLLGHLLAVKGGTDYETLVIERICTPLTMSDTRMTLSAQQRSRIAPPHDGSQLVEVWEDETLAGAGSFLSSASDMANYVRAHWSPADHELTAAMSLATKKLRPTDTPQTAIGLGWHITSENALDIVWHNGGSGGTRSYIAMLPDRHLGIIVLANWSQANTDDLGRKLLYLVNRL